jgi:hypothetical protein
MMTKRDSSLALLLALVAGLLYALGINSYVMPESTDDLIYMEGARNLASHGAYTHQGLVISDWPPFYSMLLASLFKVFPSSLVTAKVVTTVSAMLALWLAAHLLTQEQRRFRWSVLAVFAMLPTGYLCAVRTSADWTFIALGLTFLLFLRRLAEQRQLLPALATGFMLGCAALTRHIGVFLGVAIVAQAIWFLVRRDKTKRLKPLQLWPEALAATVGASLWLGWAFYLKSLPPGIVAPGLYDHIGGSLLSNFHPLDLMRIVGDYFAQIPNIFERLGLQGGIVETMLCAVIGVVLITGMVRSMRHETFRASDWYVLAYLLLITSYEWKLPRFLIPVGPWLIDWFLEGTAFYTEKLRLGRKLSEEGSGLKSDIQAVAGYWCGIALLFNMVLVFFGHPGKLHGPLMAWRSPTAQHFYGPLYQQLAEVGAQLSQLPETELISTEGFYANYLHEFSGRRVIDPRLFKETIKVHVAIDGYDEIVGLPAFAKDWQEVYTSGAVRVFTAKDSPWQGLLRKKLTSHSS